MTDLEILHQHMRLYPEMEIQDGVKLLYQKYLGTGHMAPSFEAVTDRLSNEREGLRYVDGKELFEPIGNGRYRLHLNAKAAKDFSNNTLAQLFLLEAKEKEEITLFEETLVRWMVWVEKKELSFSLEESKHFLEDYQQRGYPPIGHSEKYRNAYMPAYRVVGWQGAFYQEILLYLEEALKGATVGKPMILAIDGRSGSGKSHLGAWLHRIYPQSVLLKMDDFFLPQKKKTVERLATPGGNVDYERVADSLLSLVSKGETAFYQPFNCHTQKQEEGRVLPASSFYIVEGSYSLHPSLQPYYQGSVFLTIPPEMQKQRILTRNGEKMLPLFLNEWIPLEEHYFSALNIPGKARFLYDTSKIYQG
ncbi:MAG: hypothetical protein GX786_02630 [Clostridiales bacterium]|nr:hypothetical protein [Clostridiales bacterium]